MNDSMGCMIFTILYYVGWMKRGRFNFWMHLMHLDLPNRTARCSSKQTFDRRQSQLFFFVRLAPLFAQILIIVLYPYILSVKKKK
jgi:hypothetical protein